MKLKIITLPLLLAASVHGSSLLTLSNPVADGSINTAAGNNDRSDWTGTIAFPMDPDESNATDFSSITVAHDASNIYIREQLYRTANSGFFSGSQILFLDTDQSLSSGYTGPSGTNAVGAEYLLEGVSLFAFTGGTNQTAFSWNYLGAVTYDDFPINDHELSFAASLIGSPTAFDLIAVTDYFGGDLYPDSANGGATGGFYTYSIPEPASVVLGSLGMLVLLKRRGRNR